MTEIIIGYNKTFRGVMNKDDFKNERAATMSMIDTAGGGLAKGNQLNFENQRMGSMSIVGDDQQFNSQFYTDQYIAFLKQVRLNISAECIRSFYDPGSETLCTFPLYQMAIKFYNH